MISSPDDVAPEREAVLRVAARLNRPGGAAERAGVVIEVLRWETVIPASGPRPLDVILAQLPVARWDVFVGILWARFGTPPGGCSPESGALYGSGTEEEFDLAYRAWRENGRPWIAVYRCLRPLAPGAHSPEQWRRVEEFFRRFEPTGANPGIYKGYRDVAELERLLYDDLEGFLALHAETIERRNRELARRLVGEAPPEAVATPQAAVQGPELGKPCDVAFLSVDVHRYGEIVRRHADGDGPQLLVERLRGFVERVAAGEGGRVFSWAADGGSLIFWGEGFRRRCLVAGLRLLHELEPFNVDPGGNPLEERIRLRVAVTEARITLREPTTTMSIDELNFVVHLQEQGTEPGELCVPERFLTGVPARLAALFEPKGVFEGRAVSVYRGAVTPAACGEGELDALVEEVARDAAAARRELPADGGGGDALWSSLAVRLDDLYGRLETFCRWFPMLAGGWRPDPRWSAAYLGRIASLAARLAQEEAAVYAALHASFLTGGRPPADRSAVAAPLVRSIAARRAPTVVNLEMLATVGEPPASPADDATVGEEGLVDGPFRRRLRRFEGADELDREEAAVELLAHHGRELVELVAAPAAPVELGRFWEVADLLLQIGSALGPAAPSGALLEALCRGPGDPRFAALRGLLAAEQVLDPQALPTVEGRDPEAVAGDREVFWRSLVVAHQDPHTRAFAGGQLGWESAWTLLGRLQLPVEAIYDVGRRFRGPCSVHLKKLFFDTTRQKTLEAIRQAHRPAELAPVHRLVLLYAHFDFVVETLYFGRLHEVLDHLIGRTRDLGLAAEELSLLAAALTERRRQAGEPFGSLPWAEPGEPGDQPPAEFRRRVRAPIRRCLATERPYWRWLLNEPIRICGPIARHASVEEAAALLRRQDMNVHLVHRLAAKKELAEHPAGRQALLTHHKCEVGFARRAVAGLRPSPQGRRTLCRVALAPTTNAAVRTLAMGAVGARNLRQVQRMLAGS